VAHQLGIDTSAIKSKEALIKQTQKLLWQGQWYQALDFAGPRVAQLRWLAIKRGFIQRLPNCTSEQTRRGKTHAKGKPAMRVTGTGLSSHRGIHLE
jgi:hypothetical protein